MSGTRVQNPSRLHHESLLSPDLIVVIVGALPGLQLVTVRQHAVGKIEAEALVLKSNTVVVGVEPLLLREVVKACPNLHANTICRTRAGIETEIRAVQLHFRATLSEHPVLSRRGVAIININRRAIREISGADINTLAIVTIGMQLYGLQRGWWGRGHIIARPNLVIVVVRALPSLDLITVRQVAVREVKAQALILKGNAVVASNVPLLLGEVVEAGPNFHADTICRVGASIQTEVCACELYLARAGAVNDSPVLCRSTIAIVDLHWGTIGLDIALKVQALPSVEVRMKCSVGQGLTQDDGGSKCDEQEEIHGGC